MTILGIPDGELPKALIIGMIVKEITVHYRLLSQYPNHSRETQQERQDKSLSQILFQILEKLDEKTLKGMHQAIQDGRTNKERPETDHGTPESR